jgi:hypothetical protein
VERTHFYSLLSSEKKDLPFKMPKNAAKPVIQAADAGSCSLNDGVGFLSKQES